MPVNNLEVPVNQSIPGQMARYAICSYKAMTKGKAVNLIIVNAEHVTYSLLSCAPLYNQITVKNKNTIKKKVTEVIVFRIISSALLTTIRLRLVG